jgi:hypothetical protein
MLAPSLTVTLARTAAVMYGPALKALLAKAAGPNEQGALQGVCAFVCVWK